MSIPFYEASVATYLQTLKGTATVLSRGRDFANEGNIDLDELIRYRLRDDMAPFSFQLISVWHHSMGCIQAMKAGIFEPPPKMSDMTYARVEGLVAEATEFLEDQAEDEINALSGREMIFRIGGRDLPFTTDRFLLSFSLPNFFFHAATTYDVLRLHGVPLGKMDFLGPLRMGH